MFKKKTHILSMSLFFLSIFSFIIIFSAVIDLLKNWAEYSVSPLQLLVSFIMRILQYNWLNQYWIHYYWLKSVVWISLLFLLCSFVGFEKCIIPCIYYYSSVRLFTLKMSHALLMYLLSFLFPHFYCFCSLPFLGYQVFGIIQCFFWMASFT